MKRRKLAGRGVPSTLGAMLTVFLLVLAALAGGCGGAEDASSSADEAAEQETEAVETESTQESATTESEEGSGPSIGEIVVVGDVAWAVTDVEESDILVSRLGSEEGNFVIVDLNFQNNSNQDITFATPFVTLVDGEGREFEADIEYNFTHVEPENNMFAAHVQPGVTKAGKIIFSVAPDSSGLQLRVGEAKFASDESASIDLDL
ncbi:MAG: hypothetical protein AVDCRST_MAG78-3142 [uncultured Rubrobacteraceae bacterium]|uniref:DUF4352 domain-containing protein n=1 Tax=uncultured Rubrobacteraceae bacterium TaxID=349277 RepID=A0A6J4QT30_9ACTN|nr:MAG: hypothetical protein AVDCRST_MAG78-3142 [uncultured Rubrobacteraceae bacterium]